MAVGRAQPLSARNPIQGFDRLIKRVVDRLLYSTETKEKDGRRYSTRVANPVTANMVNAVVNAVRLQLDIFSQFAVSARLEEQKAELEAVLNQVKMLKQQREG